MMGIDLLRQDKKWKEALMDIRHLMADLVQKVINKHIWGRCL